MKAKVPKTRATASGNNEYPLINTRAKKMLADALKRVDQDKGWSQRQVAAMLGYKSSVIVSHMAHGRVPVPLDRALDYARLLSIDPAEFVLAVLEQRYPDIDFMRLLIGGKDNLAGGRTEHEWMIEDLEAAAGKPLNEITPKQLRILREVAADANAERRWANINEVALLDIIRAQRPDLADNGLSGAQRKSFAEHISSL